MYLSEHIRPKAVHPPRAAARERTSRRRFFLFFFFFFCSKKERLNNGDAMEGWRERERKRETRAALISSEFSDVGFNDQAFYCFVVFIYFVFFGSKHLGWWLFFFTQAHLCLRRKLLTVKRHAASYLKYICREYFVRRRQNGIRP